MNNQTTIAPSTEHLPGPWDLDFSTGADQWLVSSNNKGIAMLPSCRKPEAQLIIAAPEMLAALKFARGFFDMEAARGNKAPSQLVNAINKAISKAKGIV
jgi:hypothetical protein